MKRLVWLVKNRPVALAAVALSFYLTLNCWEFYKSNFKDFESVGESGGIGLFMMAFIGLFKFAIDNIPQKHEGDEPKDD